MVIFPSPHDRGLPHEIRLEPAPIDHKDNNIYNKVVGSLVGLAIGDALGACVEFRPQKYLAANPIRTMEGGGTWGLQAGKWTDDTSMALCLASSLIIHNKFNPYDQMVRYKWWLKYGYFSSTGQCFDIGQATRQSLIDFSERQKILKLYYRCRNENEVDALTWDSIERTKDFQIYSTDAGSAGNGALMRLAPVPLFFYKNPQNAIEYAGRSASLTHANKKAIDACRYYAALIVAALLGSNKEQLLDNDFYQTHKLWFGKDSLDDDILKVSKGSYKKDKGKDGYEQGIRGKGYIVNALEAALWAFWSDENSFEKGALNAVNLGDDTDTTAAIYGQLAGAYYGYSKIPADWLKKLYARELIISMSEWIFCKGSQLESKDSENKDNTSIVTPNNNLNLVEKNTSITNRVFQKESSDLETLNKYPDSLKTILSSSKYNYDRSLSSNSTANISTVNNLSTNDDYMQHSDSSAKSFRQKPDDNDDNDITGLNTKPPFYPKK